MTVDYGFADIVAERYDAGVRSGEAVPQGRDRRPDRPGLPLRRRRRARLLRRAPGNTDPSDLAGQACINMRLPTYGGLYAWEFERDGREQRVHVEGQLTFNTTGPILAAALDGFGLAYLPEDLVKAHLKSGRLMPALEPVVADVPGPASLLPPRAPASLPGLHRRRRCAEVFKVAEPPFARTLGGAQFSSRLMGRRPTSNNACSEPSNDGSPTPSRQAGAERSGSKPPGWTTARCHWPTLALHGRRPPLSHALPPKRALRSYRGSSLRIMPRLEPS